MIVNRYPLMEYGVVEVLLNVTALHMYIHTKRSRLCYIQTATVSNTNNTNAWGNMYMR